MLSLSLSLSLCIYSSAGNIKSHTHTHTHTYTHTYTHSSTVLTHRRPFFAFLAAPSKIKHVLDTGRGSDTQCHNLFFTACLCVWTDTVREAASPVLLQVSPVT